MFGWVLAGPTSQLTPESFNTSHHVFITSGDDLLQRFWEIEENTKYEFNLSPEKRSVVQHFEKTHCRAPDGRFIVPLPKKCHAPSLGESRSHAVWRFLSLERSLLANDELQAFDSVMQEYFVMQHAELVPTADLEKPTDRQCILPSHACCEERVQHYNEGSSSV